MSVWALSLAYKKSADFDEDKAKVVNGVNFFCSISKDFI